MEQAVQVMEQLGIRLTAKIPDEARAVFEAELEKLVPEEGQQRSMRTMHSHCWPITAPSPPVR